MIYREDSYELEPRKIKINFVVGIPILRLQHTLSDDVGYTFHLCDFLYAL